jgi:HEAT repeat protein/thiol-disulfide isomerase/thioredoxin
MRRLAQGIAVGIGCVLVAGGVALKVMAAPAATPASPVEAKVSAPAKTEPTVVEPEPMPGFGPALEASEADGRLILVIFEASWCRICEQLRTQTIASSEFRSKGGPLRFVLVDIDTDKKMAAAYGIGAVPESVLMTAEQKIVTRVQGFLPPAEFLKWLEAGRQRIRDGYWEGTAPSADAEETLPEGLTPEELKTLVQSLGKSDPVIRTRVGAILEARKDDAVPALLDGLEDPYLGVRVGAREVLLKLAPRAPAIDPWAPPDERKADMQNLRKWASETAQLSAPKPGLDPEQRRAIETAIEEIFTGEAPRRTNGMSVLVRMGASALPAVRDALAKCPANDHKTARVLDDVRWAILVPDALESTVHARLRLARGTSTERQAAALALKSGSAAALPALRELVDDNDGLVKESAVAALKDVGGPNALAAMAVLLKAKDTSVRMVTAQALGQSKNRAAGAYLATAVTDPDEVVACVAIAALEEVKAVDQTDVLLKCLSDKRWRVRAAAAEVLGKMDIKTAAPQLAALLDDSDGFVVRSALLAMRSLGSPPTDARLRELMKKHADLVGLAVEVMVRSDVPATLKAVETVYDESNETQRQSILDALAKSYSSSSNDDHWKPLLEKALAEKNTSLRQAAAGVIARRSVNLSVQFITRLLEDKDEAVRAAGALRVLGLAAHHWGVISYNSSVDSGILAVLEQQGAEKPRPITDVDMFPSVVPSIEELASLPSDEGSSRTVVRSGNLTLLGGATGSAPSGVGRLVQDQRLTRARELRTLYDQWHALLVKCLDSTPEVQVALAIYVTGDGRADLSLLERTLARPDFLKGFEATSETEVAALILRRLPWPEGKEPLGRWSAIPEFYAYMLYSLKHAPAEVRAFLLDPDRIAAAIESASDNQLKQLASPLLSRYDNSSLVSTLKPEDFSRILDRLKQSSKPLARAMAYAGMNRMGQSRGQLKAEDFEKALTDESPLVRCVGLMALATILETQEAREEKLGSFVADKDPGVAALAALVLMDDGMRSSVMAGEMPGQLPFEEFSDIALPNSNFFNRYDRISKPLLVLAREPPLLAELRKRVSEKTLAESPLPTHLFALLMGQYGDFSGLELILKAYLANPAGELSESLLVAAGLTRDPKYLPVIRKKLAGTTGSSELMQLLGYLRGIRGEEARLLRQEINERLRAQPDN